MSDNPFGPGSFGSGQDNYIHHPHLGNVRQVEVVAGGGWIYQFFNTYGPQGYVFVPNMGMWAAAIGEAMVAAQAKATPQRIGLDTTHHTDRPQMPPSQGKATS